MWCLSALKRQRCSFFSNNRHNISRVWFTRQLSTLFTSKIKYSQSVYLSPFFLSFTFTINFCVFLLGLHQGCPWRLAHNCFWKQVSSRSVNLHRVCFMIGGNFQPVIFRTFAWHAAVHTCLYFLTPALTPPSLWHAFQLSPSTPTSWSLFIFMVWSVELGCP